MNDFFKRMFIGGDLVARRSGGKWMDVEDYWDKCNPVWQYCHMSDLSYFSRLKHEGFDSLYFCGRLLFYRNAPLHQVLDYGGRMWIVDVEYLKEVDRNELDILKAKFERSSYVNTLAKMPIFLCGMIPLDGVPA